MMYRLITYCQWWDRHSCASVFAISFYLQTIDSLPRNLSGWRKERISEIVKERVRESFSSIEIKITFCKCSFQTGSQTRKLLMIYSIYYKRLWMFISFWNDKWWVYFIRFVLLFLMLCMWEEETTQFYWLSVPFRWKNIVAFVLLIL